MVWYSHLFKNLPQFVVIHPVKGLSIVNEAQVGILLGFSCFFYDPVDVGSLISLQSKILSRVFSNTTDQKHQFFGA